jgi:hypothetical protein
MVWKRLRASDGERGKFSLQTFFLSAIAAFGRKVERRDSTERMRLVSLRMKAFVHPSYMTWQTFLHTALSGKNLKQPDSTLGLGFFHALRALL